MAQPDTAMTAADLARIAAAIEQDAATEAANWPLSRERTRAYIRLARTLWEWVGADVETGAAAWPEGHDFYDTETRAIHAALAALAPAADAGAGAGEAPKTQ